MSATPPGTTHTGPFVGTPAGGIPNNTDIILSSIFIALFLFVGIYFHLRIFHAYKKKFIWSILCFGFCMARIAALSFRIVTAKHPRDKTLNIIAQVFIAAGVVLLFFVNLQMARRFWGQLHPQHARPVKIFINSFAALIIPVLAMVITTVVQSFLTTDPHILSIDRKVRLVASVFLVFLAFLPIPVVLLVLLLKAMSPGGLDKDEPLAERDEDPEAAEDEARQKKETAGNANEGQAAGVDGGEDRSNDDSQKGLTKEKRKNPDGRPYIRGEPKTGFGPKPVTKREILETALFILIPGALLTFEQGIRCTQAFHTPKPGAPTPWYMTKPAFWTCIFTAELIAVVIFGFAVLPRRFSHLRIL
ncbi:hypothetical protein CPB86DRAFT_782478 [Serendipita vermifera]|nr:hypothetical protein CPB86DRAFT_782478 [Serendipita vermifera]